jgi:hypothetical protein
MIVSAGPARARIIAAYKTVSTMGAPLGALVGGTIAVWFGAREAITVAAFLSLLVAVYFHLKKNKQFIPSRNEVEYDPA